MHRFYSIGLEKWYKPLIWLGKKQNNLLWCQNDVVMSFLETVNQGESLASWLNWLTGPPAVCWCVIMGDLSANWKGVFLTLPKAFRTGPPSCAVHSMEPINATSVYIYCSRRTYTKHLFTPQTTWNCALSFPQQFSLMKEVVERCPFYVKVEKSSVRSLSVTLDNLIRPQCSLAQARI